MSKRRFVSSPGGSGIAAGTPFVLNGVLAVSQAAPPVARSTRLSVLQDAQQSIVAPSVAGAVNSFVMGELSSVPLAATRTIALGFTLTPAGAAGSTDQVVIGANIVDSAARVGLGNVLIGSSMTLDLASATFDSSVLIGRLVTLDTGASHASTVLIGAGAVSHEGNSVGVGASCTTGTQCVAVGRLAAAVNAGVAIGDNAHAGNFGVTIGFAASVAGASTVIIGHSASSNFGQTVAIGRLANAAADDSVCIGYGATISAGPSIAIGRAANAAAANTCVLGSDTFPLTLILFNDGISTTTRTVEIRSSAANPGSVDLQGSSLRIVGGWNTGAQAGGGIEFHTGAIRASGGTLQTLTKQVSVIPSAGGAGAPNLRFDNVTTGAGAGAGTLLNAPTAGDPVFWLPVSIAGAVRYIPCWP